MQDSTSSSTACSSSCVSLSSPYPYYTDITRLICTSGTMFTRSPSRASMCALPSRVDIRELQLVLCGLFVVDVTRVAAFELFQLPYEDKPTALWNVKDWSGDLDFWSVRSHIAPTPPSPPAPPSSGPYLPHLSRTSVCPTPLPSIPDLARIPPARSSSPSHCPCVPHLAHMSRAWSSASRDTSYLLRFLDGPVARP
ncbi:hypothetical protein OBBRIDRAFT_798596 [Obba rivulosa]|uniref:Uncharacterized protein n=1 Tax=Obba rivulosa TaxID=1052685 RepID=A0A8E2ATI8_9APHY|nr:hypothetical protein OBBRIDRAFT_798596 [Obba rivulosa]